MCVSDWRFGRLIKSQTTVSVLGAAGVITINPNRQRIGLTFSGQVVATTTTTMGLIAVDTLLYKALGLNYPAVDILMKDVGEIVTHGWTLTNGTTPSVTYSVTEYFATEEMLQGPIDEFSRRM